MGTTLDEPLYYMNSTRILMHTGLGFYLTFTHSLRARQVFGVVAGEKFCVDIDNNAIDSTLDQFYFISFFLTINNLFFFVLVIMPYFTCVVTLSRLHACDFRKAISVHAKTRSHGITSIRSLTIKDITSITQRSTRNPV